MTTKSFVSILDPFGPVLTTHLSTVNQLLEAGSDPRLSNNEGLKPVDVLPSTEGAEASRRALRNAEAVAGMSKGDVVGAYQDSIAREKAESYAG